MQRIDHFRRLTLFIFSISLAFNLLLSHGAVDWRILPAGLIGWYLADAASGAVHMYMDYRPCPANLGLAELFFYPETRSSAEYLAMRRSAMSKIGPFDRLVYDFKNHHPRPDALGRRDFVELVWSTVAFGALPLSLALNIAALLWTIPLWLMAGAIVLLVGGALAQYFHATLHRPDTPLPIRVLRSLRLLMTPRAHARHHATLRRDFATNCGWSNRTLNPIFLLLYRHGILESSGLEPA